MRVKSLLATVGVAVAVSVAVPGVSMANRGGGTTVDPVVQPRAEEPVVVEEPAVEAPAVEPVEVITPAEPVVEEPAAAPAPAPAKAKVRPVEDAPVVEKAPAAPVVKTPPVVVKPVEPTEAKKVKAPEGDDAKGPAKKAEKEAGPCHMDSYQSTSVTGLSGGEAARAGKVDRNGNGTVCRKDIPGKGRGNTGEGSNIKDDQVR